MGRRLITLAVAILTSGIGVSINLATDLRTNVWAWTAVGVLTVAIGVITALAQPPEARDDDTHTNVISGTVNGTAMQVGGDINGPVTLGADRRDADDRIGGRRSRGNAR